MVGYDYTGAVACACHQVWAGWILAADTMKEDLKKRWDTEPGRAFVENLGRLGRSGNGYEIRTSPFGLIRGWLDLRGLMVPERTLLRRITFRSAEFTGAVLKH